MIGGKRSLLVLQNRDRRLLAELDTLRVIDRDQARIIGPFGSVTRANTRLGQLTTAGLLTSLIVGTHHGGHKHLYARTRQGAAVVRQTYRLPPWNVHSPIVAGQPLLEHQLRLNAFYLVLHSTQGAPTGIRVRRWQTFSQPPMPGSAALIPDAYVELGCETDVRPLFVEMDLATEPLRTWTRKVDRYLAVARSGAFTRTFGHPQFGVAVIVPSMGRLHSLRRAIATRTSKLFWLTTFEHVLPTTVWSTVWWRPTEHAPVSII